MEPRLERPVESPRRRGSAALARIVTLLLARSLSTTQYGSYSFATSALAFAAMFFEFGLFLPTARRLAQGRGHPGEVVADAATALRSVAPLALVYPYDFVALLLAQGLDRIRLYSLTRTATRAAAAAALGALLLAGHRLSVALALAVESGALLLAWTAYTLRLRPAYRNLAPQVRAGGAPVRLPGLPRPGPEHRDLQHGHADGGRVHRCALGRLLRAGQRHRLPRGPAGSGPCGGAVPPDGPGAPARTVVAAGRRPALAGDRQPGMRAGAAVREPGGGVGIPPGRGPAAAAGTGGLGAVGHLDLQRLPGRSRPRAGAPQRRAGAHLQQPGAERSAHPPVRRRRGGLGQPGRAAVQPRRAHGFVPARCAAAQLGGAVVMRAVVARLRRARSLPPGVVAAEIAWRAARGGLRSAMLLRDRSSERVLATGGKPWAPFLSQGWSPPSAESLPPGALEACLREADAAIAGRFHVLGHGLLDFGRPPSWHSDPVTGASWRSDARGRRAMVTASFGADIKVPWEASRMHWLVALARAGRYTADPGYARAAAGLLQSWRRDNPIGRGVNWCNAMEVGIRAVNLVWASEILQDRSVDRLVGAMLPAHGRQILGNLEYSPRLTSNHYLADVVGLLYVGAALRRTLTGRAWLRFAAGALGREVCKQFDEDGVN